MPWSLGVGAGAGRGTPPPSMGDSPAIGAGREHQQRWQRMAEAARRVDDAQRWLQRLWSDALREAAVEFAAELAPPLAEYVNARARRRMRCGSRVSSGSGADRFTTLADYIDDCLADCVNQILKAHRLKAINLLGVCQGGVLSLCSSAPHPPRVRNLITVVMPVDFHTRADLRSTWVAKIDVSAWVNDGNVSSDALNQLFLSLMPFRLTQQALYR